MELRKNLDKKSSGTKKKKKKGHFPRVRVWAIENKEERKGEFGFLGRRKKKVKSTLILHLNEKFGQKFISRPSERINEHSFGR